MFDLKKKRALVTGGSKGLGYAMAEALRAAGAEVAIASRHESEGMAAAQRLGASWIQADLGSPEGARRAIDVAVQRMGGIDILVNNAGQTDRKPALSVGDDDWDRLLNLNVKAVFRCAVEAARHMKDHGSGKIINISSGAWRVALPGRSVYCSTKAAVAQLTRVLAMEWAAANIQVNAIAPGFVRTELNATYLDSNPDALRVLLSRIPAGRIGSPSDIGGAAVFLSSEASSYLTGQIIEIDGGLGLGVDLSAR